MLNEKELTIYPIGTKFIPVGRKNATECTVVDILKTYNSKNELVSIRYVSQHEFAGQKVTNHDVVALTIARGLIAQSCACGILNDDNHGPFTHNCLPF